MTTTTKEAVASAFAKEEKQLKLKLATIIKLCSFFPAF